MKISGPTTILEKGYILTGYYVRASSGVLKPKLYELSSTAYGIQNFSAPYDVVLLNTNRLSGAGNAYLAVGRRVKSSSDTITSNTSGAFYFSDVPDLVGACHGYGRDDVTFYSGYNYYNAFYPVGYFQPPFGETTSLFKLNKDGEVNLIQGSCMQMSITEYNEQFGILSKVAPDAGITSDTLTPGAWSLIIPPKETCPNGTVSVGTYDEEIQASAIPGTASSLAAPSLYNHHAIPTSLDNYDNWVDGRYKYTTDSTDPNNVINNIQFGADLRPIPSYSSTDTNNSRLNNVLCYAQLFETDTAIGKLTNGQQMIESPDVLQSNIGSQVSVNGAEPWHFWHFNFRENSESFPFFNDYKQAQPGLHQQMGGGTQLFTPVLSSEDYYWQNRQCPNTVNFLPWTFGASIYACPSNYFDIPYYAAIKKFGFYGTRFLNSCKSLNLDNTWQGVDNALELPAQVGPLVVPAPDTEPDGIDVGGAWSFTSYDNLLKVAKAEERYSNMYALNKGFFIWANTGCIAADPDWQTVASYGTFPTLFTGLISKFQQVYTNGFSSLFSGEPKIIVQNGDVASNYTVVDSGFFSEILFTNHAYEQFYKQMLTFVSGEGLNAWNRMEAKYAYYFSDCNGGIFEPLYQSILSGRQKRIRTRFFENVVRGNPVDLFPLNHITFGTDQAREMLESTGWGRVPNSFGKGSRLPPISRRYFEGAYGNGSASTGLALIINKLSIPNNSAFYPGFFNTFNYGKSLPNPSYVAISSGVIMDTAKRRFSPSGWLAAGYNEIGKLDSNFSCFTPIFVQQPIDKVFCKIGQQPTFRALAVDYHSIPEDKISFKYPEIIYWTYKLKINNSDLTNRYPMQYKWLRVKKDDYANFSNLADFKYADFSNSTGQWCALEGDNSPTCTLIHPTECVPPFSQGASTYTFVQGAKYGDDDQYYYMCLAIGRFGIRISEPSELAIENWLRFDLSYKNGMNAPGSVSVNFIINDSNGTDHTISFQGSQSSAYAGYQYDPYAIPEGVVEMKMPPPNAGYGDVSAVRFIGPTAYVGATRSYVPDTLFDTRGLRERWGRFIDYGALIPFSKYLSQGEGNLLYGYQHLPKCSNYAMSNGQHGIRVEAFVNGNKVNHWTLDQKAYASLDSTYGMVWNTLNNPGSLYPPASTIYDILSPNMGVGHWQWGNNLGAIKRFGQLSTTESDDLRLLGHGVSAGAPVSQDWLDTIKKQFIQPSTLAGANCGYTPNGLGRNMIYYIEAFDRFYLICDPIKKKNVQNISFMCPGLRHTNSAIQYFWLGQPNNIYVERRSMFGPYAFQWKVRRHNRDRNGNGISEGFYSMGYGSEYTMMYDAPAIYGLYVKKSTSSEYVGQVNAVQTLRNKIFGTVADISEFRNLWFGEAGVNGTAGQYGNFTFSCDPSSWAYNKDMCDYVSAARDLATNLDFRAYSCPIERLRQGQCFDPCLSIRYSHGFFPGGKAQDMFGPPSVTSSNLPAPVNLRLVSTANYKNEAINTEDEPSLVDPTIVFRGPVNTPHARAWRGLQNIDSSAVKNAQNTVGVSPCKDGGSDHCNYITPTLHMDTSSIIGSTTSYASSVGFAANVYAQYNIRGGD